MRKRELWVYERGCLPQSADDLDTVLIYHDSTLYRTDVDLFKPGCWVNDHCILFQCEYVDVSRVRVSVCVAGGGIGRNVIGVLCSSLSSQRLLPVWFALPLPLNRYLTFDTHKDDSRVLFIHPACVHRVLTAPSSLKTRGMHFLLFKPICLLCALTSLLQHQSLHPIRRCAENDAIQA